MVRSYRIFIYLLIFCLSFFANPARVLAIPSLPSSFYGSVKLNGANVPDGTVVQAFVDDQMIAQGYTQTYEGDSVYTLDVPGDDTETAKVDGGSEGDTISFKIGGIFADETGTWHSGTNVQLNLTITSGSTLEAPQATPTHVPTQTPIGMIQGTPEASNAGGQEAGHDGNLGRTILIIAIASIMLLGAGFIVWNRRRKLTS